MTLKFLSSLRLFSALGLVLVVPGIAEADVYTYSYTGPNFDTYNNGSISPLPDCCVLGYPNISAYATFSRSLGPYAFLLDFSGLNILGADSLVRWGITGVPASSDGELELGTDGNGNINNWYLATYLNPISTDAPLDQVTLFESSPGFDEIFSGNDIGSQTVLNATEIGTWTESTTNTPEPGANLTLKLGGLFLLIACLICWQRRGTARTSL